MTQDNRGASSSKGGRPGGDRRDGRPRDGKRGRPQRGDSGKGPAKPVRVETYEDVKQLTRGAGFRIEKSVVAEKRTHRPVRTEYRLFRDGLAGPQIFARLADAQTAATEPLPEPDPAPAEAIIETSDGAADGGETPAERD